jgi:hypothetical protein
VKDQGMRWALDACLYSEVLEDGWVGIQPGLYGDKTGAPSFVSLHPYGFLSRPSDPEGEDACQALLGYEGDQGYVLPLGDGRVFSKLPALKKGGSVQYGSDGGFGLFDPEMHTHTLFVPAEFSGATPTKSHLMQIGVDPNGLRVITLLHSDGQALSMLSGGKRSLVLKNSQSTAYVEVNDDGIVLNGLTMFRGAIAEMVGPLEAAVPTPMARATPLLTWATQLVGVVNLLVAYVNAIAPGTIPAPADTLSTSVASGS